MATEEMPEARVVELERQLRHLQDERARYEQRFNVFSTSYFFTNALTSADSLAQPLTQEQLQQQQAAKAAYQQDRQAAERRAFDLLEQHIGKEAAAAIQNGGAYPVKSALWEEVVYLIPRDPHERIKVLWRGAVVTESCLVSAESLPWADLMLQRIRAVQLDESIVFSTGIVHDKRSHSMINQALRFFGLLKP